MLNTRQLHIAGVTLLPAGVAVTGILWLTSSGLHLTSDSVHYLAAGRSLAADGSLVGFGGEPYVRWPPLLPLVIAAFSALDMSPLASARMLNAALYGGLVGIVGAHLFRTTRRVLVAGAGAWLLAVHPWVGYVHAHLWSEPLFLLWALLALVSTRSLWRLTVFTCLAVLTRYAGLALVPVGAAALLLDRRHPVLLRWRRAGCFTLVSLTPLLFWSLRNRLVAGTAFGDPPPTADTVSGVVEALAAQLVPVMAPYRLALALPWSLWFILLCITWAVALYAAVRAADRANAPAILWIGAYTTLLVAAAARFPVDPMGPRLLVPVLLGVSLALPLLRNGPLSALVAAGVLSVGVHHESRLWTAIREDSPGTLRSFARTPMAAPHARHLVSNYPEAVYLTMGRHAGLSPRRTAYRSRESAADADVRRLREAAGRESTALIWFRTRNAPRLLPLEDLAGAVMLDRIGETPALEVYVVRPARSDAAQQ